jgi:hypothetical protein
MLHALLLGIFKYVRDCFFEQIGDKSKLAAKIDAMAVKYGELYSRQSNLNMSKMSFHNGIQQGKLMAKENPGVLLILATLLVLTKGSELLKGHKQSSFVDFHASDPFDVGILAKERQDFSQTRPPCAEEARIHHAHGPKYHQLTGWYGAKDYEIPWHHSHGG